MEYDIIGDIHGHADALEQLLLELGYTKKVKVWTPPQGKQAIFLGDFVDRGPKQLETIAIVRHMLDAGVAQSVMGNHELNAIAWHTFNPNTFDYLRPRQGAKGHRNRRQHSAFLAEVEHRPQMHDEIIAWMKTLPLWLALPEINIVHAAWNSSHVRFLSKMLTEARLSDALIPPATDESIKGPIFTAVEILLKGVETNLPHNVSYTDPDGNVRTASRIRWWDTKATSYRKAAILDEECANQLPDTMGALTPHGYQENKPLFIGHYWNTGSPAPLTPKIACVDYSVAKGGVLCAYRWEGEHILTAENFKWANKLK